MLNQLSTTSTISNLVTTMIGVLTFVMSDAMDVPIWTRIVLAILAVVVSSQIVIRLGAQAPRGYRPQPFEGEEELPEVKEIAIIHKAEDGSIVKTAPRSWSKYEAPDIIRWLSHGTSYERDNKVGHVKGRWLRVEVFVKDVQILPSATGEATIFVIGALRRNDLHMINLDFLKIWRETVTTLNENDRLCAVGIIGEKPSGLALRHCEIVRISKSG